MNGWQPFELSQKTTASMSMTTIRPSGIADLASSAQRLHMKKQTSMNKILESKQGIEWMHSNLTKVQLGDKMNE